MSMIIQHDITMDLTAPGVTPRIHLKQGDLESRQVALHLYTGDTEWTVPEDVMVMIRFHVFALDGGEDIEGVYDTLPSSTDAWSVSGNTITFMPVDQMTSRHSIVATDVLLLQDTRILSTFNLEFYVNPAVVPETDLNYEAYYNVMSLREINDRLEDLTQRIEDLEADYTALNKRMAIVQQNVEFLMNNMPTE